MSHWKGYYYFYSYGNSTLLRLYINHNKQIDIKSQGHLYFLLKIFLQSQSRSLISTNSLSKKFIWPCHTVVYFSFIFPDCCYSSYIFKEYCIRYYPNVFTLIHFFLRMLPPPIFVWYNVISLMQWQILTWKMFPLKYCFR